MQEAQVVTTAEKCEKPTPFDIEFFMLQGVGFRCMGYRDRNGKWRSAFNHVELYGKIQIVE